MDLLSALLREMRLESAAFRKLELRAPFRVAFAQQRLRGVHIVVEGRCELELLGTPVHALDTGDLVLLPRTDAHVLRSPGAKRGRAVPSTELLTDADGVHIRGGGSGEATVIVCGAFIFHEADHPALAGLPRIVHVSGEHGRPPAWLRAYVDVLVAEAGASGSGGEVVMARLSDALVARTLRYHAEQADEAGWLMGLRDARIARALSAMHDDPRKTWTLEQLAKVAGMSRAAFAARFGDMVGEPPMKYLLRCRMRLATTILRHEQASLAEVAARVGYGSEAAFSAAFKRWSGVSPGAHRRGR